MTTPKRVVSQGYLLYEYLPDDNIYRLVGVIDSALGSHYVDEETGESTDWREAMDYLNNGKIEHKASYDESEVQP